jgi:hypothetical protein
MFNNISDPIKYCMYDIASILVILIIHAEGSYLWPNQKRQIITLTEKIIQSTKIR